ncbi:MAG: hypothetical protein K0M70_02615 [Arenimonas sp.]|uniref:hypothetical protein n=1 Tax=Arenimonas sp. TaxID=1872635 RepID=UPI0025BDB7D3|nr:hypothetical protein [Arenimonas sp.]MBW8366733.1 hypothetical protein [Arenimonas sp.]
MPIGRKTRSVSFSLQRLTGFRRAVRNQSAAHHHHDLIKGSENVTAPEHSTTKNAEARAQTSRHHQRGDEETKLDLWVGRKPVGTFLLVATVSAGLFVVMYWLIGSYRIGGFRLDDTVTNYVGSLVTTVVALAGSLVSVMLARLALKLGREAKSAAEKANVIQDQMRDLTDRQGKEASIAAEKANIIQEQMRELTERLGKESKAEAARANDIQDQMRDLTGRQGKEASIAADKAHLIQEQMRELTERLGKESKAEATRANEIQDQMRKFDDPRLKETREGHKSAASLDLLGTLLCVYASETFASAPTTRPVEAIRHTYKRGNDLVSDPALYRYCTQLMGAAETANRFASMQARIYESARMLGGDGESGRNDGIATARNAELIGVKIAGLFRTLEQKKQAVLADPNHVLHQLALDLEWKNQANSISGCETTARSYFTDEHSQMSMLHEGAGNEVHKNAGWTSVDSLLEKGARSVVHVLESDLDDLIQAVKRLTDLDGVMIHEDLWRYASACNEGMTGSVADLVVARWDSTLKHEPAWVVERQLDWTRESVEQTEFGLESTTLRDKATFLAKNPAVDRAVTVALRDLKFLREMNVQDISDESVGREGTGDTGIDKDVARDDGRLAARSAKRLRYIHAAIEQLREDHAWKGAVLVSDRNPYWGLGQDDADRAIVVIRPHFARIDMAVPGSEWEKQNQWFEEVISAYSNYRWHVARS